VTNHFKNWALEDVQKWQSGGEAAIRQGDQDLNLQPYPYRTKFLEAVRGVCGPGPEPDLAMLFEKDSDPEDSDLRVICKNLESGDRRVLFRDATLKNQLLELSFLDVPGDIQHRFTLDRPADAQSCDEELAACILDAIADRDDLQWLKNEHVFHVDFESAYTTTCVEDDFFHVLGLPLWWLSFNDLMTQMKEAGEGLTLSRSRDIAFFRSYRAWARREAYQRKDQALFEARYPGDSLRHYRELAECALREIRSERGATFLSSLTGVLAP